MRPISGESSEQVPHSAVQGDLWAERERGDKDISRLALIYGCDKSMIGEQWSSGLHLFSCAPRNQAS